MLTPLGVGGAAGPVTIGTAGSSRTIAISAQPSRLGHLMQSDHTFSGGLTVASGDVNGDGNADIIVATGAGTATSKIVTISGADGSTLSTFSPVNTTGGLNLATIDADNDGQADIIVSPVTGGHNVTVYKGTTHASLDTGNVGKGVNMAVLQL